MTNYCTSLEVSKKLVEAGWKKETEFWWVYYSAKLLTKGWKVCQKNDEIWTVCIESEYSKNREFYPAPLSDEILEELPIGFDIEKLETRRGIEYQCSWCEDGKGRNRKGTEIYDKSLPNALALMYLFLVKEGIIKNGKN